MIFTEENLIRDTFAFPDSSSPLFLKDESPTEVSDDRLKEFYIKLGNEKEI